MRRIAFIIAVLVSICHAQKVFTAYNGVDVIPAGTPPTLYTSTGLNNNLTVYDTTYNTHINFDGTTFTSGSCPGATCKLSPVTRITDNNSVSGGNNYFTAGEGGSGGQTVVNTNTSLVGVTANGAEFIGLFNTSTGHLTTLGSGQFITQNLCVSGCHFGLSTSPNDFGSVVFSYTDPSTVFSFGSNISDISTLTTVCPYSINTTLGNYSLNPCIVDFKYGLPQYPGNSSEWTSGTLYHYRSEERRGGKEGR